MPGGRLGCLDTIEAYITDQCGSPRICSLSNISQLQFNRILDDISEAVVTIPVSTGVSSTKPCCDCLDQIEPWCHELHIVRNGEEVWMGPIIRVVYGFESVVIEAKDVIAWTTVRVNKGILDNTKTTTTIAAGSNGVDVATFTADAPGTLFINDASNFSTFNGTNSITLTTVVTPTGTDLPTSTTVVTLTYTGINGNSLTGVVFVSSITTTVAVFPPSTTTVSNTSAVVTTGMEIEGPSNGDEITDLAIDVLNGAFYEHDPCILDYVVQTDLDDRPTEFANTKISPNNGFTAFDDTVFERLEILAENGLDYTVLGRSIILSVENVNTARLGTLTDEHIMGEIEVAKDGLNMATRVFARFQDDDDSAQCSAQCKAGNNGVACPNCDATFTAPCVTVPCPAISEADEIRDGVTDVSAPCYGPIERIFTDADAFDYTTAKQTADAYIRAGSIAPRTVDLSSGSRLSQDTPWEFNEMIPGQKIFVTLANLCLDVNQDFKLLEVQYSVAEDGNEEVTVSLGTFDLLGGL